MRRRGGPFSHSTLCPWALPLSPPEVCHRTVTRDPCCITLGPLRAILASGTPGLFAGSWPLTVKWFHTHLQKNKTRKQPFWTWALMRNIITEPAAHPVPLSPGQASLRRAWLQMAFSSLGGPSPYLPSTAGGDLIFNGQLAACHRFASAGSGSKPDFLLGFRSTLPLTASIPSALPSSPLPSPPPPTPVCSCLSWCDLTRRRARKSEGYSKG